MSRALNEAENLYQLGTIVDDEYLQVRAKSLGIGTMCPPLVNDIL